MNIVGILGFKGSGKDSAAAALIEDGYVKYAYADALKDVIASIFHWPRHLMEGDTKESRDWREQPDKWWAEKLSIPNFSPRMAMQQVGTDIIREKFNNQIWISNVEKKIMTDGYDKVVITDCRYQNETDLITNMGGKLIRIKRGYEPSFYQYSSKINSPNQIIRSEASSMMYGHFSHIHTSEWAWNCIPTITIENDGTLADLHTAIRDIVK